MKNDKGTFIEISEFHSGSQQGGIRVPKGCSSAGWAFFEKELRRFFLNEKPSPMGSSTWVDNVLMEITSIPGGSVIWGRELITVMGQRVRGLITPNRGLNYWRMLPALHVDVILFGSQAIKCCVSHLMKEI